MINPLLKHKSDYKELSKKELLSLLDDYYKLHDLDNKDNNKYYKPINSVRNNARRALKRFWLKRNNSITARNKVKYHLSILRGLNAL